MGLEKHLVKQVVAFLRGRWAGHRQHIRATLSIVSEWLVPWIRNFCLSPKEFGFGYSLFIGTMALLGVGL